MTRYARHQTNFCDWTCERSLASLTVHNLKVHMIGTYCKSFLLDSISQEREMVTHSNILAWRIPWIEEPIMLPSMGLQRVRHDGATEPYLSKLLLFI